MKPKGRLLISLVLSAVPRILAAVLALLPTEGGVYRGGRIPEHPEPLSLWFVTITSLYWLSAQIRASSREARVFWRLAFASVVILFNPILPFDMNQSDWRSLQVLTALVFFVSLPFCPGSTPGPHKLYASSSRIVRSLLWALWITGLCGLIWFADVNLR